MVLRGCHIIATVSLIDHTHAQLTDSENDEKAC